MMSHSTEEQVDAILSEKSQRWITFIFDTRTHEQIDSEYVDKVHRFPECLALRGGSPILKHFHMQLVTVSSEIFHVYMQLFVNAVDRKCHCI